MPSPVKFFNLSHPPESAVLPLPQRLSARYLLTQSHSWISRRTYVSKFTDYQPTLSVSAQLILFPNTIGYNVTAIASFEWSWVLGAVEARTHSTYMCTIVHFQKFFPLFLLDCLSRSSTYNISFICLPSSLQRGSLIRSWQKQVQALARDF